MEGYSPTEEKLRELRDAFFDVFDIRDLEGGKIRPLREILLTIFHGAVLGLQAALGTGDSDAPMIEIECKKTAKGDIPTDIVKYL